MYRPFVPIVKNPHLLTIAGNYWPRRLDLERFPVREQLYATEPGVQVLVHSQSPQGNPRAQLIVVHGLEGSSLSGYEASLAQAALESGYAVHRFNMRSCGGTEDVCGDTLYHSGQTCDLLAVCRELLKSAQGPDGGPPTGGGTPLTSPPGSVVREFPGSAQGPDGGPPSGGGTPLTSPPGSVVREFPGSAQGPDGGPPSGGGTPLTSPPGSVVREFPGSAQGPDGGPPSGGGTPLTSPPGSVVREFPGSSAPIYLIGFSLGGNVALKLAGELGGRAHEVIAGVCAVSTPIDLGACVERLALPMNKLYASRFLRRLKQRIRRKERLRPGLFDMGRLDSVHSIYEFDDVYTAPAFGFGTADNYYATQSAQHFLDGIRVPAVLIQAQDDPLIPFEIYRHPAFSRNPSLSLIAPEHGGHVGFISRHKPRFWIDGFLLEWLQVTGNTPRANFVR